MILRFTTNSLTVTHMSYMLSEMRTMRKTTNIAPTCNTGVIQINDAGRETKVAFPLKFSFLLSFAEVTYLAFT